MGKAPRLGDVFWVQPERLSPFVVGEPHPHVVVQADVFNESRIPAVVVCGLTTQPGKATEPGNVLLDDGEGGLPKRSVVIASQICTVEKLHLGEHLGTLSDARVRQLLDGLEFLQRSFQRQPPT